jgi:hypothetical protein
MTLGTPLQRKRASALEFGIGGVLLVSIGIACSVNLACSPRVFAGDPSTTGDSPSLNRSTSSRVENVPYCSGGQRDTDCLFGANCRITNEGCQVCQCLSP